MSTEKSEQSEYSPEKVNEKWIKWKNGEKKEPKENHTMEEKKGGGEEQRKKKEERIQNQSQ